LKILKKIREGPGVINWTKQFLNIQVDIDNATVKTTDGKHLSSYVENSSCIMWLNSRFYCWGAKRF